MWHWFNPGNVLQVAGQVYAMNESVQSPLSAAILHVTPGSEYTFAMTAFRSAASVTQVVVVAVVSVTVDFWQRPHKSKQLSRTCAANEGSPEIASSQSSAVSCLQPRCSNTPLQFAGVVVVPDVMVMVVTVVLVVVLAVVAVDVAVVVVIVVVVPVAVVPVYVVDVPVTVEVVSVAVVVDVMDVLVVVVAVVVVEVVNVVVEEVQTSQSPGQLLAAAARMYWLGFSQFFRRKPGIRQPIGSGTPLQEGSEHVPHVTGH